MNIVLRSTLISSRQINMFLNFMEVINWCEINMFR